MTQYIIAYVSTTVVFFAIDFLWLGYLAKDFYFNRIGDMIEFNIPAAVGFYLIYIVGIMIFAIVPALEANSWKYALMFGALFGFFCYATYDMTNLATLRDWPISLVVVDVIWGTVLTGSSALAGFYLTKLFVG